jgi:hypothetical protein
VVLEELHQKSSLPVVSCRGHLVATNTASEEYPRMNGLEVLQNASHLMGLNLLWIQQRAQSHFDVEKADPNIRRNELEALSAGYSTLMIR